MTSSEHIPKYYCYTCEENVTDIIQNEDVIKCLTCNQEFVEIVDENDSDTNPNNNNNNNHINHERPSNINNVHFPNEFGDMLQNILGGFLNRTANNNNRNNRNSNVVFNFQVINNFAQQQQAQQGQQGQQEQQARAAQGQQNAQMHFPNLNLMNAFFGGMNNNNNNNRNGNVVNFGDFAFGDMQQIIQNLVDNNRVGPPPTAKSAIDELPQIVYHSKKQKEENPTTKKIESEFATDEQSKEEESDSEQKENVVKDGLDDNPNNNNNNPSTNCAVCKDKFCDGEILTVLPCKHNYHRDCILPWLNNANNCPICRYRLPTDDQMYEHIQEIREQQQRTQVQAQTQAQTVVDETPTVTGDSDMSLDD